MRLTLPSAAMLSLQNKQHQAMKMVLPTKVGKDTDKGDNGCEQTQRCPLITWCKNNSSNNNNNNELSH